MEERKSGISWVAIAVSAAMVVAIIALVLTWKARTELRKEITALSMLQLRSAALASEPYREELNLVRRFTDGDRSIAGSIESLAKLQDSGIPNLAALNEQLDQAAAAALITEQSRPELGVFDSLASRIAATAVVVGLEAGSNPLNSELGPVIASAEKTLHEGKIDQSIATLKDLPPELSSHFDSWRANAESRLAAEKAIEDLTVKLVGATEASN